jgi:Alr-MurF fusion protein
MQYNISEIANIVQASVLHLQEKNAIIENVLTDSRRLLFAETTLFFALPGQGRKGTDFIPKLIEQGVKNFVVSKQEEISITNTNILQVDNVLTALQQLASYHRAQFNLPVIGITGSNGKTIVKEWLNQLLASQYSIVRSPLSYNSQIGVPLSIFQTNETHSLALFEAGISTTNEMQKLQKIINPNIGILTNIGQAHAEGFSNAEQKLNEKLLLFTNAHVLIYNADDAFVHQQIINFKLAKNSKLGLFSFGKNSDNIVQILDLKISSQKSIISCKYQQEQFSFTIPFTDEASIQNACTCVTALLYLGVAVETIVESIAMLKPIAMRLELKQGLHNCSIINDSYSADLQSFIVSLDFLMQQQQHKKKTIIISDFLESGNTNIYEEINAVLKNKQITRLIGIGENIKAQQHIFTNVTQTKFYNTTNDCINDLQQLGFSNETILLKGARKFSFENISKQLEQKIHETQLEINLQAIKHNLKVYKSTLLSQTKVMAMVKAFSYGSGSFEIANTLQNAGINYLAVAYTDEGVQLRNTGISLPILVLNTDENNFEQIIKYRLEPELFSFTQLHAFSKFLLEKNITQYPVHIKIDTGMKRLGFELEDIDALCSALSNNTAFKVASVFTHLVASDAPEHDDFTELQVEKYETMVSKIQATVGYTFLQHIANSSAITRYPQFQKNMVRLGIGLYGIDSHNATQQKLQTVATLKTSIAQIKHLAVGETVGYNRNGVAVKPTTIATVRIGYADGYPRNLGNGVGKMLLKQKLVPTIGNICMDMCMVDITGIDAKEGDDVIVFGENPTANHLAKAAGTIPYEILTNISQRVKRVYFEE